MQFYDYKGYVIYPAPVMEIESGCWKVEVKIRHGESLSSYSTETIFSTKGEAVFHALHYGKRLIDDGAVLFGEAE